MPDPCVENPPAPPPRRARGVAEQPPTFGLDELFRIQSEMVLQCERLRDRFALLDAPLTTADNRVEGIRGVADWRARFDSTYAALYFPWVRVVDPLAAGARNRARPPTGHVAGTIAATDLEIGVHNAPANRRIEWAVDASVGIDDTEHGVLNAAGVNALRTTAGRGLRVQGARTVSSDPAWRFVNVRRLMSMIEKALEVALQWAVFEPNEALTRARVTMSVTIFLLGLHEAGMLAGATPEESFFVKCDLDNNPAATRDLGRLIVEVGVAPSKPFEFVVLRVGRVSDALEDGAPSLQRRRTGGSDGTRRPVQSLTGIRLDPPLNHNFLVMIVDTSSFGSLVTSGAMSLVGDVLLGGFSECSGTEDGHGGRQAPRRRTQQHRAPVPDPHHVAEHRPQARRVAHLAERLGLAVRLR